MFTFIRISLLTIWSFNSFFSTAQNYTPITAHHHEWHLTSCNFGCLTDVYYTKSDTVYNGYHYKVLAGYHYISNTFWIRDDVTEKQVFLSYIENNKRLEVLLYDFSMQVGDSILINNPISPFPTMAGYFKLDSIIPTTLLDGNNHDSFYLSAVSSNNSSELPVWIEGMGSLSMINAPGGTPDVNGVGKISCFFQDNILLYAQMDSISDCNQNYPLDLYTIEKKEPIVYPTIYEDMLVLNTDLEQIEEVKIYSLEGKSVFATSSIEKVLHTAELPKGVYFVYLKLRGISTPHIEKVLKL